VVRVDRCGNDFARPLPFTRERRTNGNGYASIVDERGDSCAPIIDHFETERQVLENRPGPLATCRAEPSAQSGDGCCDFPITSMNHSTLFLKRVRFVAEGDTRYLSSVVIYTD